MCLNSVVLCLQVHQRMLIAALPTEAWPAAVANLAQAASSSHLFSTDGGRSARAAHEG